VKKDDDAPWWLMVTVFVVTVFVVGSIGYGVGERATCSPDNYPRGSIGQTIAFCIEQGGNPDIDYKGRFSCRKSMEVETP
jgi:hypothetical protein